MASKLNTILVAFAVTLLATSLRADEQSIGPLDPSAGTVTASLFPTSTCPGTHDLSVAFVPFTIQPQFAPVQWLNVPTQVKLDPNQGYIDVTIPLDKMAPGTYLGAVIYRCDSCSAGGECTKQLTSDLVRVEVAAPATFGASSADQSFGGLVNGQPVSIHDLTVNVIGDIKKSSFMQLTGATEVIDTLESNYADRRLTSNDLSDITFVQTAGTTDNNGRMSTQVQPVDDEDVLPGNGRYVLAGAPNAEEIYVGVDMSLKGITEARKHPQLYYVFTLDGKMGVIHKGDFVHNLAHEGLHAHLGGKYNTATTDGKSRGACLEEEVEGFRVGNAAARALGLPEDTTTPGANYGGGRNLNYPTQFPQLQPGQESTDPTRKTPTKTSAVPTQTLSEQGFCRVEGTRLNCQGTPGYALACATPQHNAGECSLQGTGLKAPCTFGASGWACTTPPAAVAQCAGGQCQLEAVGSSCQQDGKGVRCAALPAYGIACAPGGCTLSDPLADEGTNALAVAAQALHAATQSVDCNRAGLGEFRILNPLGGLAAPSVQAANAEEEDLVPSLIAVFARELAAAGGLPQQRFAFQFAQSGSDHPSMAWPGTGSGYLNLRIDELPQRGVVDVTPVSTGLFKYRGLQYQVFGGYHGSAVYNAWLDRGGELSPFDLRHLQIGDSKYTSALFDEDNQTRFFNAMSALGYRAFDTNPCRSVLVPTDPNYKRTGRNGGNSWGEKRDDQWAIKRIGYTDDDSSAWRLVRDPSAPVVVAVIDTGLDWHHADIDPASLWRNEDEVPDNGVDDDKNGYVDDVIGWDFVTHTNRPWDYDGHGTFVTGIIVARHNDIGIAGIAPNARIMVLKGVSNFGTTRASWLAESIVYAVDNGAKILNLSVGGPHESKMEQAALDYARRRGVLVVAAAGNSGVELKDFGPGGHDSVLTVGATHVDDRAAEFSNFGDKVDIVAPGVEVLSLRARGTDVNYRPWQQDKYKLGDYIVGTDKRYEHASGTSFATPIVTATAALVLGNNPKLTATDLTGILTQTAMDIEAPGRDPYSGHGMINPRAALAAAPDFRMRAEITRVELTPAGAPTAAQVFGTIEATHFKRAWMQIGPGENPSAWRFVAQKRKLPIRDGQLASIPLSDFAPSGPWTVVVNVEDKNGVVKRGKYLVQIP